MASQERTWKPFMAVVTSPERSKNGRSKNKKKATDISSGASFTEKRKSISSDSESGASPRTGFTSGFCRYNVQTVTNSRGTPLTIIQSPQICPTPARAKLHNSHPSRRKYGQHDS
eukprot:GFKZ01009901.1.p1 GENE.GFKZ01009901.1~~GFKZ01009901.1.p1  ORF type:complete len:115 (-),score=4.39 GFKZ01009901.1:501-845(-)